LTESCHNISRRISQKASQKDTKWSLFAQHVEALATDAALLCQQCLKAAATLPTEIGVQQHASHRPDQLWWVLNIATEKPTAKGCLPPQGELTQIASIEN